MYKLIKKIYHMNANKLNEAIYNKTILENIDYYIVVDKNNHFLIPLTINCFKVINQIEPLINKEFEDIQMEMVVRNQLINLIQKDTNIIILKSKNDSFDDFEYFKVFFISNTIVRKNIYDMVSKLNIHQQLEDNINQYQDFFYGTTTKINAIFIRTYMDKDKQIKQTIISVKNNVLSTKYIKTNNDMKIIHYYYVNRKLTQNEMTLKYKQWEEIHIKENEAQQLMKKYRNLKQNTF